MQLTIDLPDKDLIKEIKKLIFRQGAQQVRDSVKSRLEKLVDKTIKSDEFNVKNEIRLVLKEILKEYSMKDLKDIQRCLGK